MKNTILTNYSPHKTVQLQNTVITPGNRVSLEISRGIPLESDSLIIETNNDWNLFNNFIIFHTFIFNSYNTIKWYEYPDSSSEAKFDNIGELTDVIDYENILGVMYKNSPSRTEMFSYRNFYEQFSQLDLDDINLIKNHLIMFPHGSNFGNRKITDASYWEILKDFSTIEVIIGEQKKCSSSECPACGKGILPHNLIPVKDWFKNRLDEIIGDKKIAQQYLEVILFVKYNIRNGTTHSSMFPTAEFQKMEVGEAFYDFEHSRGNYEIDYLALLFLRDTIKTISRNLLLNKVFNTSIFTDLKPLVAKTRIVETGTILTEAS